MTLQGPIIKQRWRRKITLLVTKGRQGCKCCVGLAYFHLQGGRFVVDRDRLRLPGVRFSLGGGGGCGRDWLLELDQQDDSHTSLNDYCIT